MNNILENSINNIIYNYYNIFLRKKNVVGLGLAYKAIKGIDTKEHCLQILVEKKVPLNELFKKDLVPKYFLGVKTDVIEIGSIEESMYSSNKEKIFMRQQFKTHKRPLQGGYSIGFSQYAGTLGAIVFDNKDNTPYILSNSHVLNYEGVKGTPVFQPALIDGGNFADKIGSLHKTIRITVNLKDKKNYLENEVDCAIAMINPYIEYSKDMYNIGIIKGTIEPKLGLEIRKIGRSTGYTSGTIKTINAMYSIKVDKNSYKLYKNQIITSKIGNSGDSGAVVVDFNNNAVGLLSSGSKEINNCNPINKVLSLLNIHF